MPRLLLAGAAGMAVFAASVSASAQEPSSVTVHVDAPRPVRLEARSTDGWKTVCTSPCDAPLPVGAELRANADDMHASEPMTLAPGARTTLLIEPSEKRSKVAPIVVTVVGAAGLVPIAGVTGVLGGVVLIAGLFVCPVVAAVGETYGRCMGDAVGTFTPLYGLPYVWIPAIVGTGMVGAGVTWLATSNGSTPTTITQTTGGLSPRGDVGCLPATLPPMVTLPVWRGSF